MYKGYSIGVVIPALNEAQCVKDVIADIRALVHSNNPVIDEIVLCDNGSTDATAAITERAGVQVEYQATKGYGIACSTALGAMKPVDIVLFINADGAESIIQSIRLLDAIVNGADLVVGSRVLGKSEVGTTYPHQRFGNWLVVSLINKLWQQNLTDLGPFRAIRWNVLRALNMQDRDFGWTVEMEIQSIRQGFVIEEIPINTYCSISRSKVSGTLSGTMGAAKTMIATILSFAFQDIVAKLKS